MTDTTSGAFEPLHSAHAVEQVSFTIQIQAPWSDKGKSEAERALSALSGGYILPKKSELRTLVFSIGNPPAPAPVNRPGTGYLFQRFKSDGTVEAEVKIDTNSIVFRSMLYTRWAAIYQEARSYLEKLSPSLLAGTPIAAIGLTYVDKFIWNGEPNGARASALFKKDSPFLARHIFERDDFWHSHTGAFVRADPQTKRLININVDCLDQVRPTGPVARAVSITTVINDMFNQPGYTPYGSVAEPLEFIDRHLEDLHNVNKSVLAEMITDQMSKRIALES